MKVRMNEKVTANIEFESNQYLNLTNINDHTTQPNNSIALITLYKMPQSTITFTNETFSGIKSHKLIMTKEVQIMILQQSKFEDIRTPDLCKWSN